VSLPVPRNPSAAGGLVPFEPRVDEPDLRVRQMVAVLTRSKWLILGCAVISFSAAAIYTRKAERVYQAYASLRIEEKQPDLPDVLRTFSQSNDVSTDIEVLGSRTLREDATRILGLQVRLISPRDVPRDLLVEDIQATRDAEDTEYRLTRQSNGSFEVRDADGVRLSRARPGERLWLRGVTLRLKPAATQYPELRLLVRPLSEAVANIDLTVGRAGREADIVRLRYEDTDRGLVWKVPNVIVERFIERRQEAQKVETRSQAKFLREQIDTLAVQLAGAEEELKAFRERSRVVNPAVEASSQINRLVNLQAERSSLEAERSALAGLLEEVEGRHKRQAAGKPSVYRELLAFPSLLRSQAASQLLSSLAQVEDQRATLLTRRTEADPDILLLSARINELENQLSTIALAYLQGLTNQVRSLDTAITRFGGELGRMPRKELEFARLERKPLVLKEMYALLQTRLKEAEIAEAAVNTSLSIVDPAIPPRGPFKPKARLIKLVALVGGTLLGIGLALIREYADYSIKTRSDATAASGLPVVAIVPRIRRRSNRPAVIAKRSAVARLPQAPPQRQERQPSVGGPSYSFWSSSSSEQHEPGESVDAVEGRRMVPKPAQIRMSLSPATSAVAEAYAILQTNVAFSRPEQNIKVLVLTSPLPGEGKTTTAVNLALTLCQRGLSVCLIDADLRRPQIHEVFRIPREPGLSEVLRGLQSFEGSYRPVQIGEAHHLDVLTAGSKAGSAPALIGSARMRTLLNGLRDRFDLIVLDTPPVNILTDAALLGVNADGVVVVVRAGSTDGAALGYAMEQLNHVRAPALGVVLNDVDLKSYGAYDGAYRYYSYAAYTDASPNQG
jgi:capsular exopolysaccharide synthesis family protein